MAAINVIWVPIVFICALCRPHTPPSPAAIMVKLAKARENQSDSKKLAPAPKEVEEDSEDAELSEDEEEEESSGEEVVSPQKKGQEEYHTAIKEGGGFPHKEGWIWSRESQKEIEKEREVFRQRTADFQRDLEAKYHTMISENRRAVAQLSLELEKEQNRTTSYREALISQGRKLVEEKKLLEQERARVMQEKRQLQPLRSVYQSCLEEEEDWQRRARLLLKDFEEALTERQSIYCSLVFPRTKRWDLEKSLLVRASVDPVAADLQMVTGLTDIFKHDTYCADVWNSNRRRNGRLMWLYLKYWELVVELRKFQRVEKAILEK
ncbi:PREDICTED: coiled-coil domain-containing protein 127 [Chrysochloris asiatica]|uniref:Coiled-coil domain-containing protein 127 n=1 Tax=Chrysochloris asiatica TaxID=185453 RepID=A0A9B0U690_CHRAS|nr:PREDICTED: coiled-coil domain-containing protein 127 [Chrysochloris asiatica]